MASPEGKIEQILVFVKVNVSGGEAIAGVLMESSSRGGRRPTRRSRRREAPDGPWIVERRASLDALWLLAMTITDSRRLPPPRRRRRRLGSGRHREEAEGRRGDPEAVRSPTAPGSPRRCAPRDDGSALSIQRLIKIRPKRIVTLDQC